MATTCRSCGALIRWARTKRGKKMPIDAARATGDPKANVVLYSIPGGREVGCHVVPAGEGTHIAHWETCPGADAHRKVPRVELVELGGPSQGSLF